MNASPLAITGVIDTRASDTSSSSTGTATVNNVNLLSGIIRGQVVKAVSSTAFSSGAFHTSGSGSELLNLQIGSATFSSVPAPNTKVSLSGIGYVVLNEQIRSSSSNNADLTVNMIHVFVTLTNSLGVKPGVQIIVAHAHSGILAADADGVLDGYAYGTKITVGNLLRSTATAPVSLPCTGTNGDLKTASIAGVNIPGVLVSGTISSTAKGVDSESTVWGTTNNGIQTVNLLNGLVQASIIKSQAHVNLASGVVQTTDSGSQFLSVSVKGHPTITASANANTSVSISGVGTLYLHRVLKSSNSIEVRMIELVVNQSNTFGLAIGTDIRISVSHAGIHTVSAP